jgi:thiamine biosynthesis lipoprotein
MAIASDRIRRARPLLGTFVEIEATGPDKSRINQAIDDAFETVAHVHRLMSFQEPASDVSRLNREAMDRPVGVHAWTFRVLEAAVDMHRRSNGIFDISVAPILQDMGLLPPTSNDGRLGNECPAFDAIELLEGQMIRFRHPDVRIDLGGIAKGFAVDQALEVLRKSGAATSALVNAGGDLAAFGEEARLIHVRHPRDPRSTVCAVDVKDEALASSARRFDLFHSAEVESSAIIDPVTGKPANAIDGVTVRAPSCMTADALTKIGMIMGTDAIGLLELYNASALLISADGDVQISPDFRHAVHLAA